jgi:hypothetical protein
MSETKFHTYSDTYISNLDGTILGEQPMKIVVIWYVTLCSLVYSYQYMGGL